MLRRVTYWLLSRWLPAQGSHRRTTAELTRGPRPLDPPTLVLPGRKADRSAPPLGSCTRTTSRPP